MKVEEILRLTGASRSTFYRWRKRQDFPEPTIPGDYNEAAVRGWWDTNRDKVGRWPGDNGAGTWERKKQG